MTRDIAKRLAEVGKALEDRKCDAEDVAHFLMRCIFTMFAKTWISFRKTRSQEFLKSASRAPEAFAPFERALEQNGRAGA